MCLRRESILPCEIPNVRLEDENLIPGSNLRIDEYLKFTLARRNFDVVVSTNDNSVHCYEKWT